MRILRYVVFHALLTHLPSRADREANSTRSYGRLLAGSTESPEFRPHEGQALAEIVKVGVIVRKLYGIDVKRGSYTVDLICEIHWHDHREYLKELLPEGEPSVSFGGTGISSRIWTPEVLPTNRDLHAVEDISITTEIFRTGDVKRTRRMLAQLKTAFDVSEFPFDEQELLVLVASSKYMQDQVSIEAMREDSEGVGVEAEAFGKSVWSHVSHEMTAFNESSGSLHKSRGKFAVRCRRDYKSVMENTVFPEVLLLGMASSIFFLPLQVPFAMPRVATGIICYLTMATFQARTATQLPASGTTTWLQVWENICSSLMFLSIVINVTAEYVMHTRGQADLARILRRQYSFAWLALAAFMGVFVILFRHSIGFITWVSRLLVMTYLIASIAWALKRTIAAEQSEQRRQADEAQGGLEMAAKTPLISAEGRSFVIAANRSEDQGPPRFDVSK